MSLGRRGAHDPGLEPTRWGLSSREDGLWLGPTRLADLTHRWGSPLFVIDARRLDAQVERFLRSPPGRSVPLEIYYSYKTNPVPAVLARLLRRGVGAEVVSPYELWLALRLGASPANIIYNGPGKSDAAVREVVGRDLMLVNLNHREEIAHVARVAGELGKRPTIGLRVSTEDSWSGKFGVRIAGGQALAAYEEALRHRALRVVALHAHRGVTIRSAGDLEAFVRQVLAFCDELHGALGLNLELLDLGGGLGVPTAPPLDDARALDRLAAWVDSHLSIEGYLALVAELVEEHFCRVGRATPRVLLEPGRALTGSTQMLLCRVVSLNAMGHEPHAILDAGESVAHILHREYHEIFHASRGAEEALRRTLLDGPTCSPMDVLRRGGVPLPALDAGDTLAIMDAGAYFVSFSNSFCFPQPGIVLVDGAHEELVRRPETYEDMIARDLLSGAERLDR